MSTAGPKCKLRCKCRNKQINGKKTELLTVFFYSNDVIFSEAILVGLALLLPIHKGYGGQLQIQSACLALKCIWCLHPHIHVRTQSVYAYISSLRGDRDIELSSFLSS